MRRFLLLYSSHELRAPLLPKKPPAPPIQGHWRTEKMASTSSSGSAVMAAAAAAEKESYRGVWIPCILDDPKLRVIEEEGLLHATDWWRSFGETIPNPRHDERVHVATHLDRGLSFPPSYFFSEVIGHYGVHLHHLPPNSILEMSSYASLCEGYLGIRPSLTRFRYYFHVRRNSITVGNPYITGTISFSVRKERVYPRIMASESVKQWSSTFFYHKDIPAPGKDHDLLAFIDGTAMPQESWDELALTLIDDLILTKRRNEYLMKQKGLKGSDLVQCWVARRIQPLKHHGDRLMHSITLSKKDSLRISPKTLEPKDYVCQIRWLIGERIERKIPELSLDMHTAEDPVVPVSFSNNSF